MRRPQWPPPAVLQSQGHPQLGNRQSMQGKCGHCSPRKPTLGWKVESLPCNCGTSTANAGELHPGASGSQGMLGQDGWPRRYASLGGHIVRRCALPGIQTAASRKESPGPQGRHSKVIRAEQLHKEVAHHQRILKSAVGRPNQKTHGAPNLQQGEDRLCCRDKGGYLRPSHRGGTDRRQRRRPEAYKRSVRDPQPRGQPLAPSRGGPFAGACADRPG